MAYSIIAVKGVPSNSRRGIAFLKSSSSEGIDASRVFDRLKEKVRRDLRSRFEYWRDGGHRDNYFHGWPNNNNYKYCFVFKWKDASAAHRLYGFLCHPRPTSDPRFEACILVMHAQKNTNDTDFSLLDTINTIRLNAEIVKAYILAFDLIK